MSIAWLLKRFREYERHYMGDIHDHVEWQHDFLEFVAWLIESGLTIRAADGLWVCPKCSFVNYGDVEACSDCKHRRR
jgi:hypothetical protein